MARDPHRKIQLRLETKRRFEMDTLDQAGIPTTKVTVKGLNGYEKMKLVDVQALRSKCQGLSEGIHSVHKLVELQQRKDSSMQHSSTFGPSSLMASSSMPTLGSLSMPSEEAFAHEPGRWKDRYQKSSRQFPSSGTSLHTAKLMQTSPDRFA